LAWAFPQEWGVGDLFEYWPRHLPMTTSANEELPAREVTVDGQRGVREISITFFVARTQFGLV